VRGPYSRRPRGVGLGLMEPKRKQVLPYAASEKTHRCAVEDRAAKHQILLGPQVIASAVSGYPDPLCRQPSALAPKAQNGHFLR
jgi:hypothetical protein